MSEYHARIDWALNDGDFLANKYSRDHTLSFAGDLKIPASASPFIVPPPWVDPAALDPEQAYVASLSSCHMLWFLALAAKQGFIVERYSDDASGTLGKNTAGLMAMTCVTLRPDARFSGDTQPTTEQLEHLHHQAHERCFISNSVKTEVRCEPKFNSAD